MFNMAGLEQLHTTPCLWNQIRWTFLLYHLDAFAEQNLLSVPNEIIINKACAQKFPNMQFNNEESSAAPPIQGSPCYNRDLATVMYIPIKQQYITPNSSD